MQLLLLQGASNNHRRHAAGPVEVVQANVVVLSKHQRMGSCERQDAPAAAAKAEMQQQQQPESKQLRKQQTGVIRRAKLHLLHSPVPLQQRCKQAPR
jgi:hypothetical protein